MFLASCTDPIIEKSRALLLSVEGAITEARNFVESNRIEDAYAVLEAARQDVDKLLDDEFNGDRCLFHDSDDGPCPFETKKPYTGKRDEGVQWNMYRANLWLVRTLESVQRAESVAAYREWDRAVYPTRSTVSRFLISDYGNPSWQDVVIFNLFVRPSQNICAEVSDLANNEFERASVLDKWRASVSGYGPTDGDGNLLRGIHSVRIGEYSSGNGAFENRNEVVSRGTWSFEVRGESLVANVTVKNVLARGTTGWSGVRRDCNVSYQAIASAIASQTGEQVNIPDQASLDIHIENGTNILFQDISTDRETAESLISRYQSIGERMATSDRQVAAVIYYEANPASVSTSMDGDAIKLTLNAAARNVTFFGFSNADWYNYGGYAGTFGEESLHEKEKTPDTLPLMSKNVD